MELKKYIAEHKEEIIGKQPLTDTPIIEISPKNPQLFRVNTKIVIISKA